MAVNVTRQDDRPVLRFRRGSYRGENSRGDRPRWHRAVYPYRRGGVYTRYEAVCGFVIERGILADVRLSTARRPPHGEQWCLKCERHAETHAGPGKAMPG